MKAGQSPRAGSGKTKDPKPARRRSGRNPPGVNGGRAIVLCDWKWQAKVQFGLSTLEGPGTELSLTISFDSITNILRLGSTEERYCAPSLTRATRIGDNAGHRYCE